jgi:hypothetical protein
MPFIPENLRKGRWRNIARLVIAWALLAAAPLYANDAPIPHEFQIKAVFLYNFAQFIEWPPDAFESTDSPLVIGVLGLDPFGDFLDETVRGETVNGRRLVVERYRWISEIDRCHVLFVSGSEGRRVEQILSALQGRPILTVCDWEGLAQRGAMIRFVMQRNRVRLRINLDAAKQAGLTISSKLLRSAEMVTATRQQP